MLSFGALLHFLEIYTLMKLFGTSLIRDYVFGTYFRGVGAVLALSNHAVLRAKVFSVIGRMVLGIYAVHYIFVDILRPIDNIIKSVFWEVSYVFLVLVLSILSVLILSKSTFLRCIIL